MKTKQTHNIYKPAKIKVFSMGRIKTAMVKNLTKKLYKNHKPLFKEDFNENKLVLADLIKTESKKLRNVIAGYLTRLVKQERLENT